ncbi:HAD hydrolase-like protein [Streptomyces pactum]|uniref:HAD hydrolase-like protein n=1 Tax=Streptomyces pactum TaxID=68249 RepID=UPI003556BB5E
MTAAAAANLPPGLVHAACRRLGVTPRRTVVIGDIGSDLDAARAAGALGILVPTPGDPPRGGGRRPAHRPPTCRPRSATS